MHIKPKLIDNSVIEKMKKHNRKKKPESKIYKIIKNKTTRFFEKYSSILFIIVGITIILYLRYKQNIKYKKMNKKPDYIEVNYIKNNDFIENKLVDVKDNIEIKENTTDKEYNILDIVKDEINKFDSNELEEININELSSY